MERIASGPVFLYYENPFFDRVCWASSMNEPELTLERKSRIVPGFIQLGLHLIDRIKVTGPHGLEANWSLTFMDSPTRIDP